ncbi:MAG: erythromycin biosynthesis sensory transduction protein eryC1 [Candidatus Omnitrophota bacterium]|nr:MAG: erythromycin biosynthesis sensory transduction protein eryC1 [Candidatus Omnitrophota bacterium]RKY37837.1 MAG: erythromycin biosynthesis sensory transduction protein eryC1 [Candidatus Omnitrophota bacterium]
MIPFVDLKTQYKLIEEEIRSEIEKVLQQGNFILGEQLTEFEEAFADFCDSQYCIGVASGTDALCLALHVLGIGPGDEVITAANTFVATVFAISYVGAIPVLVDIDPTTYNIDLDIVEKKITSRTKVIIPVHLYGRSVDMGKLLKIASKYGISIIEDACQAHGAIWEGKKVGSWGTMGCFSFYPAKNLGAYGDGGAIVTSDKHLYEKLRMLRNYGSPKKYHHDIVGYNSRLDTLQAAILRVKLRHLDDWNKKRVENAIFYNEKLKDIGDLVLPEIRKDGSHVFHLYVVRTKERDALLSYLKENGVQCGIHYPIPIYSLGAYSTLGYTPNEFPITEAFSKQILSLPMYPELNEAQMSTVVSLIKKFYQGRE